MIKDTSKIMMWYVWMVTYPRRNVTIVRGASYHLLGSQISWDLKILFWLSVKSYISDWQISKLQHLASYVSHHNAMAYDTYRLEHKPYLLPHVAATEIQRAFCTYILTIRMIGGGSWPGQSGVWNVTWIELCGQLCLFSLQLLLDSLLGQRMHVEWRGRPVSWRRFLLQVFLSRMFSFLFLWLHLLFWFLSLLPSSFSLHLLW